MDLNIAKDLNFKFSKKALLVGGKAKEFYGIRKSGPDIDFIICTKDHKKLEATLKRKGLIYLKGRNKPGYKEIPEFVNLYGDYGLLVKNYEIWDKIRGFDYDFLSEGAKDKGKYLIICLEKLLFLTALAIEEKKYSDDLKLIVKKINTNQYKK